MERSEARPVPSYAVAIHGGAGVIDKGSSPEIVASYETSLRTVLEFARDRLAAGDTALDVAEAVVKKLEDDPNFNAGRGAVFTAEGVHELDASIMDGRDLSCGAVAGVLTVKNPITLARLVKERTRHVLLSGTGAEKFADSCDVERVPNSYFDTEKRRNALIEWRREHPTTDAGAIGREKDGPATARNSETASPIEPDRTDDPKSRYGTVGCVCLDRYGNLAAATSTGGMTGKRFGRVGDSPIIGAGTYADNATCAVSCTGTGEEFIRHGVAKTVSDRVSLAGDSLDHAARHLIEKTLKKDDGGLIAVSRRGEISMPYNSDGMFRGAADSSGRFEIGIWEEMKR